MILDRQGPKSIVIWWPNSRLPKGNRFATPLHFAKLKRETCLKWVYQKNEEYTNDRNEVNYPELCHKCQHADLGWAFRRASFCEHPFPGIKESP